MLKSYKYRLYPDFLQKELITKHFSSCRFIYNLALETRKSAWDSHKVKISSYALIKQITDLKKDERWLKEISNTSLQKSILQLEKAYLEFFKGKGFPKFKNKYSKKSFTNDVHIKVDFDKGLIRIPKFQNGIKCVYDRRFDGKIKSVTISETRTNKFYASVLVDTIENLIPKNIPNEKTAVGIDLGIKSFAVTSDDRVILNPKFLKSNIERLKVLQKRASKKQVGSANRIKANLRVAKQQEKIVFQRNDFLHKLSKRFITENQGGTICLETLNIKEMMKNHNLARSIQDASWGEFVNQLKYKGDWYGVNILQVDMFALSSKTCTCGYINKNLTLNDRVWICSKCNVTHDRDLLAANNIKNFAFKKYSGMVSSGEPVETSSMEESEKQEELIIKNLTT
jgi:putative transposase